MLPEPEFYVDPDVVRDAVQHRTSFNVIHLSSVYKVDIFVMKTDRPYLLRWAAELQFSDLLDRAFRDAG